MSFKKVVVVGAGPLGLMAAIEAQQNFVSDVTLIEKRIGYTRLNVPTLDPKITQHFQKINVADTIWKPGVSNHGDSVGFSKIEEALFAKATGAGVKVERGWTVEGLLGRDKNKRGRYKTIVLTLRRWDEKGRKIMMGGGGKVIETDFLIVSTGGAAAADPLVTNKLGFHFHKLAPTDYGAYGIFTPQVKSAPDPSAFSQEDYDRQKQDRALAGAVSGRKIAFHTEDHNYLLVTLQNCSAADFKRLRDTPAKLKQVLLAIGKAMGTAVLDEIKQVEKNMALFEISIQRAQQFYSPEYPAVLLGDAAVTPHPEQGSGITTGFHGFEKLMDLFKALKKLDRSNNTEKAFTTFNGAVELIASKKALEGTRGVLQNNLATLTNYISQMKAESANLKSPGAKKYIGDLIADLEPLRNDLTTEGNRTKDFLDALAGGNLRDSGLTIENLWKVIRQTHNQVQNMIKDTDLMGENLEKIQARFV